MLRALRAALAGEGEDERATLWRFVAAADGVLDHHWPDCVDHDTEAEFDAARAALPEPGGTQPGQRIVITGEDGQQVAGMFYADRPGPAAGR